MRITNKMMTNNMMYNINKNKNNLSILDQQYSSGKKIQRPSQDPIVAVRALKLRTNLSELNQYYEKNIPDAKSWMDVTENALDNMNTILGKINTECVSGSNDPLPASARESIAKNIKELKAQIYQEGNSNYAGRYVFTGYKTDTSLIFNEPSTDVSYKITEHFKGENLESVSQVLGEYKLSDYSSTAPYNTFSNSPVEVNKHRLRLSYGDLDNSAPAAITYTTGGTVGAFTINTVSVTNDSAYNPANNVVNYIPETGELIFGDTVYNDLRQATDISVEYSKKNFNKGDLRPEHYFNCTATNSTGTTKTYVKQDQAIEYEINFNQKLKINTQGSDALTHKIGRDVDEILSAVDAVTETEGKITEVKKMLEDPSLNDGQKDSLNKLLGQLNTELVLKNKIMHDKFEDGITGSQKVQETLNVAVTDLGSRYVRLQLTEDRLSSQQVDFEDLMSTNEDVDQVETYIKLNSADLIYNASLSAASKVVRSSLLDFL